MSELTVMRCAICPLECSHETSREYVIGPLSGRVCIACAESLGIAVARWMSARDRERQLAESAARSAVRTLRLIESEALPKRARPVFLRGARASTAAE